MARVASDFERRRRPRIHDVAGNESPDGVLTGAWPTRERMAYPALLRHLSYRRHRHSDGL